MVQTNWASLGTLPSEDMFWVPSVVQTIDGRLEVFTLDSQGFFWHIGQTSPNGTWSPWWAEVPHPDFNVSHPYARDLLGIGTNADGRLEVFGIDSQGALWHSRQIAPNGTWSPWAPLPGATKSRFLTVEKNADGRLEAFTFTLGSQVALWHSWQLASGGSWSDWAQLDTPTDLSMSWGITTAQNADGRLEIFGIDSQGALWHIWQVTPGNWGSDTAHDQAP